MTVEGKVVLITGASRGIGKACAHSFGRRGALLALTARTPIAVGADAPAVFTVPADLSQPEECRQLVEATLDHYGRIDILVNNAGSGVYGGTELTAATDAQQMFQLNFFAPFTLMQLVLPGMRARNTGYLVNISSLAAQVALPWMPLYSASKAALSSLSSGLRRELRGTGIFVTDVLPGYITTTFQDSAIGAPPPGVLGLRRKAITPEQCAESIVRGVEREARTVVTPASGWCAILANQLVPPVIDSVLGNLLSKANQ